MRTLKSLRKYIKDLLNRTSYKTKDLVMNDFVSLQVHKSPHLYRVIDLIFEKAVENPHLCHLYAAICAAQVKTELDGTANVSLFNDKMIQRAEATLNKTQAILDKIEIEIEKTERTNVKGKVALVNALAECRLQKFGNINFIGYLYLKGVVPYSIVNLCMSDLLNIPRPSVGQYVDEDAEESLECAVKFLKLIVKKFLDDKNAENGTKTVKIWLKTLSDFKHNVSFKTISEIKMLRRLHRKNWQVENLLSDVSDILNMTSKKTIDCCIIKFIGWRVHDSPDLDDIAELIFEKAAENPDICHLYSAICAAEVESELDETANVSKFRDSIIQRAYAIFNTTTLHVFEKIEPTEFKSIDDLHRERALFQKYKFGNITRYCSFIGHLYLKGIVPNSIIDHCICNLLNIPQPSVGQYVDKDAEESLRCAIKFLEMIGEKLQYGQNSEKSEVDKPTDIIKKECIKSLSRFKYNVSTRTKSEIEKLCELHRQE